MLYLFGFFICMYLQQKKFAQPSNILHCISITSCVANLYFYFLSLRLRSILHANHILNGKYISLSLVLYKNSLASLKMLVVYFLSSTGSFNFSEYSYLQVPHLKQAR